MDKILLKILSLLVVLIIYSSHLQASISKIKSIKEISSVINKSTSESLFIFDLHGVLIIPSEQILHPIYKEEYAQMKQLLRVNFDKENVERLESIIMSNYKPMLIEKSIVEVIKKLQNKKVKVIALSNMYSGSYGIIHSKQDLYLSKLKALDINLSINFEELPLISFSNFRALKVQRMPVFYNGLLLTSRISKGDILKAFLLYLPDVKEIVFIDNNLNNLMSIQAMCNNHNIKFKGFLYTALKQKNIPTLDKQLVDYQFNILMKNSVWYSDDEIQKISKKNK